jgi:hypothetical protein
MGSRRTQGAENRLRPLPPRLLLHPPPRSPRRQRRHGVTGYAGFSGFGQKLWMKTLLEAKRKREQESQINKSP